MSPIEAHLTSVVANEFAALGTRDATVTVLSAQADNWRYRVEAQGRIFEFGFSFHEPLWCREITPDSKRHLVSNDHPPVDTSDAARQLGIRLIHHALTHPEFPPRDPPVI